MLHWPDQVVLEQKLMPSLNIVKPHPLKTWFQSRGVSLKQLSELCGVKPPRLTMYLNGVEPMPEKYLNLLNHCKFMIWRWEETNKRSWRTRIHENG